MARLDEVPDAELQEIRRRVKIPRAPKGTRPTAAAPATGADGKPLVDLTLDDLKAAGVTFTELADGEEFVEEEAEEEDSANEADDEDDPKTDEERALEAWWDEFFDSMVYTVPFSFLFLMLDILTNLSYDSHPDKKHYAQNYFVALITVGMIVFYTMRYATSEIMRGIMLVVSVASGGRLIWMVNKAGWLDVIQQAPALGTIWIITIVQLPLLRAVLALGAIAAWGYWAGMKLTP